MIPNFRWPEPESPPDEKLISNVREYGCHIIRVFATESGPAFAYSVGMYLNYGQPEVIVFGLSVEHAHVILNDICRHAARGERFVAGDRTDQFLQGFDVCFTEVPLEVYPEYLGFALWFYRSLSEPFPAVQLVWPDRAGKFPWELGYDHGFDRLQPLLSPIS
jgi:uncharacterized protein DUF4262